MPNKIDRRDFFRVSALSAGGMLIGLNFLSACKPNAKPPLDLTQLDYTDFSAYIKIAENGAVTIFSPNPEIGQGVKTSMPMIVAEELGVSWDMVLVEQAPLDVEKYTRQVAGGSASIRTSWKTLREAGATARQMLINAGASRLGVSPDDCTMENGIVVSSDGKEIGIGEVVNEAAVLEIPENVQLKNPSEFTIIGQGIKNVDNLNIVTGKPIFGLDYHQDGMLFACMQRPPFGHTLESFDDTAAREIPGVSDVFRFMEDHIAVLAKDTFTAMKANKLIQPKWKATSSEVSSRIENDLMLKALEDKDFKTAKSSGDVDKAFSEADKIIERTYETPYLPHSPMEPMNFFAHVTEDFVKLVGPIQTPENTVKRVAKAINRKVSDISLELTRIGGGFGRRLNGNFVVEAALISQHSGKPVQLVYTRDDDMMGGLYRPALNYKVSAAVKGNECTGYKIRQAGNVRFSGNGSGNFPFGAIGNFRAEGVRIESEITSMAWRAPQSNSIAFAEQCLLDELTEELGKDPIEYRLELLNKAKGNNDLNYSPERLAGVVKLVAEKASWGKAPENIYQGFAAYYSHRSYAAEIAEVEMINGVPVVKAVHCAVDCGLLVNPLGADNQSAGGVIDGIGHSMYGDFSIENGRPVYKNFDQYHLIRMRETPVVHTYFVESDEDPTGLGEPTLPPAGPAVANAIYAATGVRMLKQPFVKNQDIFG